MKHQKYRKYVYLLMFSVLVWSCKESTAPEEDIDYSKITNISYISHVEPILDEYAEILSTANLYPPGLKIDSWDNLIKGWDRGEVLIPFDQANCLLIKLNSLVDETDQLRDDKLDLLKRWIDQGARNDQDEIPYENSSDLIYVCNQGDGTISIIDVPSQLVIRTVVLADYGYSSDSKPHHIVVEPDGNHWYLSLISDGKVLKFNQQNELIGEADTPTPGLLALHPTEDKLYTGRSMTAPSPPSTILSINKSTMDISEIPLAFARPHALLVQSNGKYVYTASLVENKIAVIDASTDEVEETFVLEGDNNVFVQFAESADNTRLFATGQVSNNLLVFDINETGSLDFNQAIGSGLSPWHPILGADDQTLFFGNKVSNTISVINTLTFQPGNEISGAGVASPHGSAFSDNGQYLFISNQNTFGDYTPYFSFGEASDTGTVVVVDTESGMIIKIIEVGKSPSGMGS